MLNVLVVSKEGRLPEDLAYLDEPYHVIVSEQAGWSVAANAVLAQACALGGDALFIDDDTRLTPNSLSGVRAFYDCADLFGLDLHDLSGLRQQGARHVMTEGSSIQDWVEPGPAYIAHVSTSAIYIKASALVSLRFPVWEGVHWEDVAFCLDAWLSGFRVLAVPGLVYHGIEGGIGQTKRHDAEFWQRWAANMAAFVAWCGERNVGSALAEGRIPIGAKPI